MSNCPDSKCGAPILQCRLGEETPDQCPVWAKRNSTGSPRASGLASPKGSTRLPWSGAALGTAGLAFLTARAEPKLVAVIGPHNAGKTTLLGLFYQQIGRRGHVGSALFAGSYSLEGWEAIAHALRWHGAVPRFPPHTSSGSGRAPGLLHFALREPGGHLSDVLFADSPGEWFQRWAIDPSAPDAEGARWVIERASAMLVTADCEALSGPGRGQARSDLIHLIRRVADHRCDRPVALAWTKADTEVPPGIRIAVTDAAKLVMPDIVEFETSVVAIERDQRAVDPADAVNRLLGWLARPVPRGFRLSEEPPAGSDPFFAFRAAS
jgi:hypothetical protein